VTDFKEATVDQVGVGSIVEVRAGSGNTTRYTLLGAWDGDPDNHVISYKTPLGGVLLGKKPGDTVKLKAGGGEESYTILSLGRYVDQP